MYWHDIYVTALYFTFSIIQTNPMLSVYIAKASKYQYFCSIT